MKKYIFVFFLVLTATAFSQKKKLTKATTSAALAKANNLSMELVQNNLYLFINNKTKKDTVLLKIFADKVVPSACMITPFTTKGITLNLVSWTENSGTTTKERTEDKTQIYSEIWNITTKTKPLANVQGITKIKEIQYLDKLKNASQTVEKFRNEGFAFSLTKVGDVKLKNKTQENTLSYNVSSNVYQNLKDIGKKK